MEFHYLFIGQSYTRFINLSVMGVRYLRNKFMKKPRELFIENTGYIENAKLDLKYFKHVKHYIFIFYVHTLTKAVHLLKYFLKDIV